MTLVVWALMLACLAVPAFADEPPLGRLFLTPEQRAALDNARRNRIRAEALAAAADKKPKIPAPKSVTINGVVTRSDGESTVWVNGRPTDGETEDGMRVVIAPGTGSSVVVREPDKGRKVQLKVGQRADLVTGRVQESYGARRVSASQVAAREQAAPATPARERLAPRQRRPDNERSPESEPEAQMRTSSPQMKRFRMMPEPGCQGTSRTSTPDSSGVACGDHGSSLRNRCTRHATIDFFPKRADSGGIEHRQTGVGRLCRRRYVVERRRPAPRRAALP